jgi:hypothetical protein
VHKRAVVKTKDPSIGQNFSFLKRAANNQAPPLQDNSSMLPSYAVLHRGLNVNIIDSNKAIGAASVDSSAVSGPADGHGPGGLLFLIFILDLDLREQILRISGNVKDFDTSISGNSQPLVGSVEHKGVDDGLALVLGVWLLEVMVVPHFDDLVLTARGDVETVSGDVKSVDVGFVGFDRGDVFEDTVPDFKATIPAN